MNAFLLGECPLDAIKFSPVVKNIAVCPHPFIHKLSSLLPPSLFIKVYEQVGELLVHCCYGVILKDGHAHPVVDTNGIKMSHDFRVIL